MSGRHSTPRLRPHFALPTSSIDKKPLKRTRGSVDCCYCPLNRDGSPFVLGRQQWSKHVWAMHRSLINQLFSSGNWFALFYMGRTMGSSLGSYLESVAFHRMSGRADLPWTECASEAVRLVHRMNAIQCGLSPYRPALTTQRVLENIAPYKSDADCVICLQSGTCKMNVHRTDPWGANWGLNTPRCGWICVSCAEALVERAHSDEIACPCCRGKEYIGTIIANALIARERENSETNLCDIVAGITSTFDDEIESTPSPKQ